MNFYVTLTVKDKYTKTTAQEFLFSTHKISIFFNVLQ